MNQAEQQKQLADMMEAIKKQMEEQHRTLRQLVSRVAPELLPEYNSLIEGILAGEKHPSDVHKWLEKFNHIAQTKDGNLNKK